MKNDNEQSKMAEKANFVMECFTLTQEVLSRKIQQLNQGEYSFPEFIEMIMQYFKISFVHNIMLLVQTHNMMSGKGCSPFSELTDQLIKDHIADILLGFAEVAEAKGEVFTNISLH
jgi:hypothetical protein